jgi:hypothetical protein
MNKLTKRVFGLFLALVLLFTMVPFGALNSSATGATTQNSYNTGDIIAFGSYPQTEVTDTNLIDALNAQPLKCDSTVNYGRFKIQASIFHNHPNTYQVTATVITTTPLYCSNSKPIQWALLSHTNGECLYWQGHTRVKRNNQVYTKFTWETCTCLLAEHEFYNTAFIQPNAQR